jgi:hypothetical protein
MLLLPLWVLGGKYSLVGAGVGDPIRTTGQKPWYFVYYNPFTVEFLPILHKEGFWNDFERRRGNRFLSILNICYMGNNKKLRKERFNSPATSKLIFLVKKNKHGLVVAATAPA